MRPGGRKGFGVEMGGAIPPSPRCPCGEDGAPHFAAGGLVGSDDWVAHAQGAGFEDAGVDSYAACVLLGEMAQQSGVGCRGFGVEGNDPAAGDALEELELGAFGVVGMSEAEDLAGEAVFGEGLGGIEGEDEVGAEAQGRYRVASFVAEGLQGGLRDE